MTLSLKIPRQVLSVSSNAPFGLLEQSMDGRKKPVLSLYEQFLANISERGYGPLPMSAGLPFSNTTTYLVQLSDSAEGDMYGSPWSGYVEFAATTTLARVIRHSVSSEAVMDALKATESIVLVTSNIAFSEAAVSGQFRNGYSSLNNNFTDSGTVDEVTYFNPLTDLAERMTPFAQAGPFDYEF